jgi:molybdate transport system substrate-binding protein
VLVRIIAMTLILGLTATAATASDIRVLTTGAFKPAVLAVQSFFERDTGHRLIVDNDTAGALARRIEAGEAFDVLVSSRSGIDEMIARGKVVAGTKTDLARTGIGVMVRDGAARPDIATAEAFREALLAAPTVAYIDPASGGSSGIYLAGLFERMGIADAIKPKARLKRGGYVSDLVASGEAALGLHQISEILPGKGVTYVGPLPASVQNYTVYAGGIGSAATDPAAAQALIDAFASGKAAALLAGLAMEPPR